MNRTILILRYAAGIFLFSAAVILKKSGLAAPSSALFFLTAAGEAILCYRESGNILDARIFLGLTWFSAIGLSALGLSELQSAWVTETWIAVGGFYFLFLLAYDLAIRWIRRRVPSITDGRREALPAEKYGKRVFRAILFVFLAGFLGFLLESVVFHFNYPFFSTKSHAYTSFHITGVHYFVASVIFVHPLTVYYCLTEKPERREKVILFTVNALALLISVLLLSKFMLIFGLEMSMVTWFLLQKRFSKKQILLISLLAAVFFAAGSALMIMMRKYPENYLEEIFLFRDPGTPLPFQYVYTYMVNNFENLNLMFRDSEYLTLGRRCLYPFICLTGLKFLVPVADFMVTPTFLTCKELTTLTILYDVAEDFGLIGVALFSVLLGAITAVLQHFSAERKGVLSVLVYGQILLFLFLAFFSTWFSNPTVWFSLAYTILIALYVEREKLLCYFGRRERGDH